MEDFYLLGLKLWKFNYEDDIFQYFRAYGREKNK